MITKTEKIVIFICCVVLVVRGVLLWNGNFPFSWDFARDALWVRQLTIQHKVMLVGAWGSLDNTFFGPLYFYLIAIFLFLFNGDPRSAVFMVTLFTTALIPLSYFFLRKTVSEKSSIFAAWFFGILSQFTILSLYSFPQNVLPFFFLVFFCAQWLFLKKPNLIRFWLLGFCAALFFHFEPVDTLPAFGVVGVLTLTVLAKQSWQKRIKNTLMLAVGIVLPFIPNIIFDIRHNFSQLYAFIDFFKGGGKSLGGYLTVSKRIPDRLFQFIDVVSRTFFGGSRVFALLGIGFAGWGIYQLVQSKSFQKGKAFFLLRLIGLNLVVYWLYFFAFSRLLKDYYLYMMPVLFVLGISVILDSFTEKGFKEKVCAWLFLILVSVFNLTLLWKNTITQLRSNDYRVQHMIVDEAYKRANGGPFVVYTYSPTVYDFPFQYLFSWYGNARYRYIPADYAYLPNQPDYVLNKAWFDREKDTRTSGGNQPKKIFLIQEPGTQMAYPPEYWKSKVPSFQETSRMMFSGELLFIEGELQSK